MLHADSGFFNLTQHRGLGVHISFVRSVTMDSWSHIHFTKMELGGNSAFNTFLSKYGIPKHTHILTKYNSNAASVFRDWDTFDDGIPPSQGAKYVGFGSRNASQGDVLSAVTQAIDEYKVNETVGVVSAKTTEIGQKTWGIMKGVMALASQKVEEFTKEGSGSGSGWRINEPSSKRQLNHVSSGSWDDWGDDRDSKDTSNNSKKEESYQHDSWAGWDDNDDDGFEKSYQKASNNKVGSGEKSDGKWSGGGGFR